MKPLSTALKRRAKWNFGKHNEIKDCGRFTPAPELGYVLGKNGLGPDV
jgi:hypothetical protein